MIALESVTIRVVRQDNPESKPYTNTFRLPYQTNMNITSALQAISANPVTVEGEHVAPIVYDANCLENVCGSCSMVINGKARQACASLVDKLLQESPGEIELRPMTKFPVVRDLMVDRRRMFAALKRMRAWIPVDTYGHIGEGPNVAPEVADKRYELSRCMTCGVCLEVCPQVNERSDFVGPQAIGQAVLFNLHPTGQMTAAPRLEALKAPGGVQACGNSQNCVKACPKGVPLTWAIGKAGRDTTLHTLKTWFMK